MDPQDQTTSDGRASDDDVTREELERTASPLTVMYGYTQLLQRRLHRGQTIEREELLRVLGLVEQATRTMITELGRLLQKVRAEDRDGH